jgi:transcriptional regulator with XRE-family HTH domain
MAHTKFSDLKHKGSDESLAKARLALHEELTLAELRKAREMTQKQLAEALETTQPGVSQIERRTDLYVSTLRSYIQALGGELQISAVFPDGTTQITAFGELAERDERELVAG